MSGLVGLNEPQSTGKCFVLSKTGCKIIVDSIHKNLCVGGIIDNKIIGPFFDIKVTGE